MACSICGSSEGRLHRAREMMFGLRHVFDYFECAGCGCLQLSGPPADMAPYYPPHYYSFTPQPEAAVVRRGPVRSWVFRRRNEAELFNRRGFWRWLARLRSGADPATLPVKFPLIQFGTLGHRILDVGCGSGELLRLLARMGFTRLTGIDPYLEVSIEVPGRPRILAQPLDSLGGQEFDLVMFHHSLEHMPRQAETLRLAAGMLSPRGVCLVRLPLAGSRPWEQYGVDWVELDAPRHLFVHTRASLELLAASCGLEIYYTEYDSDGFAYWGSELYRRDLPLYEPEGRTVRDPASVFSPAELAAFDRQARQDNAAQRGGRGAFYLRRRS
ncbi:MAG: class I SAM-dependent methyltransferase [Pirellulales bacterium]